ncbi:MAG: hypothetical protein P8186_02065 [Anaerolineae bacterium]
MQGDPQLLRLDQPATYTIKVQGRLDASWSAWFDNMAVSVTSGSGGPCITTLTGPVMDQVALHGLLTRIRDLGLPLLTVQCLEASTPTETALREKQ